MLGWPGQRWPIHSQTKSHIYLCSGHSRYPVTAIHTRQALKTHKETHCLSKTITFFSKVLLWVNNHFEKCAWWLQLRTYRVSFGPREARNSSRTLSPLQGRRKRIDKTCSIITILRTHQRGEQNQQMALKSTMLIVNNINLNSLYLPWALLLLEVLAVLDHPVWK